MLPASAAHELTEALNETSNNTGLNLIMALSYSSRWEITAAVKQIAADIKNGKLQTGCYLSGYIINISFY
ncbi:MAG: undecaprenyl diphosphate synthase family protein [Ferruginibacter sp.]